MPLSNETTLFADSEEMVTIVSSNLDLEDFTVPLSIVQGDDVIHLARESALALAAWIQSEYPNMIEKVTNNAESV